MISCLPCKVPNVSGWSHPMLFSHIIRFTAEIWVLWNFIPVLFLIPWFLLWILELWMMETTVWVQSSVSTLSCYPSCGPCPGRWWSLGLENLFLILKQPILQLLWQLIRTLPALPFDLISGTELTFILLISRRNNRYFKSLQNYYSTTDG